MTWTTFFKSRAFKVGSLSGVIGLGAGAGASYAVALKIGSFCTSVATGFINEVGSNFTIPELDAVVHYEQYNASIALDNINAILPESWMHIVRHADDLPPFCFAVPLVLGLSISFIASLALANTVALVLFIRDHDKVPLNALSLQSRVEDDAHSLLATP